MSEEIIQPTETLDTANDLSTALLPGTFRPPTRHASFGLLVGLTLGNLSWLMVGIPILVLVLPTQIGQLDSTHKVAILGTILTLGGLAGVITPPLSGAFSDRTTSRLGRRRPWMLAGALGVVIGLLLAALFPTVPVVAIAWILANGAGSILYAALTFVLPDRVPQQQRGTASALVGLATPVSQVVGLILVTVILNSTRQSTTTAYVALIVFIIVVAGGFILFYREPQLPKEATPPFRLGAFLKGFWVSPRTSPDFAYAWITRFLMYLAFFIVASFNLYYLTDVIHYAQIFPGQTAAEGLTIFTGITTVCTIVATLLVGFVSDRFQRRKPFVMVASVIVGLGLLTLGVVHTWPAVVVAAIFQGTGFGAYTTVDLALITQVLPRFEMQGRDLGVMVISVTIAQFIAPSVGAVILSLFAANVVAGYSTLYLVAAFLALLATVLVLPIKSVR
ncbi:MAG TPA: MFS transporter [Ktedonobacteraceae bacterium]|nr:MFS transporter [Ktedonobacteraceae bacterium]